MDHRQRVRPVAQWVVRRTPVGLVRRVRWLFLLFLLLVLAILVLGLPQRPVPWWPHRAVAAAATAAWATWAVYRYQRPHAPLATDAVPVVALIVAGISTQTALSVFGPAFVTIYFRAMFGTRRQALANAALLAGGFFLVVGRLERPAEVVTVGSGLLLVAFLAVGLVMQALGRVAGRHERATERERVLTGVSGRLLRARSESEVHEAAVAGAAQMAGDGRAASSLWRFTETGEVVLADAAGEEHIDLRRAPLDRLPGRMRDRFVVGEPYIIDPDTTWDLERLYDHPHRFHQLLVAPLVADDRAEGALVLAGTTPLDEDLVEMMGRFAHEVLLGLERARLLVELQQINADLRRADDVKNQFLSMVSHELRTPLTSIRGFTQTLRRSWHRLSEERREKYLDIVERQAHRQQLLIDDLLTTSQIMAGRLRVEPVAVEVSATVTAVVEELSIPEDHCRILGRPGLHAHVDPLHLHQAVSNLLSNAVKYGSPPYEVHLSREGELLVMQIRDHGPGVPERYREELYEPFSRGSEGGDGASGGVGLGLAIVRKLVIVNGGSVTYRADVGPGACFEIRFPAAVSEGPRDARAAPEAREAG